MGSFAVADCLTGQAINRHDRVVMLMVLRPKGGYPDAEKAAAGMAVHPFDTFKPASLPIRGTYDDYGRILPDHGQLSAEFACAMTGARDWEAVCETALSWQVGAALNIPPGPLRRVQEVQVFGSALFRESTWNAIMSASPFDMHERVESINNATAAIRDAQDFLKAVRAAGPRKSGEPDDMERMTKLGRAISILRLEHSGEYELEDGSSRRSRLLRLLGGSSDNFHDGFRSWMTGKTGPLYVEGSKWNLGEDDSSLNEMLGGLDAVENAAYGLRKLGAVLRPSPCAGQSRNAGFVSALAANTLDDCVDSMLVRLEDCRYDSYEEGEQAELRALQSVYDRLQKVMSKMEVVSFDWGISPPSP